MAIQAIQQICLHAVNHLSLQGQFSNVAPLQVHWVLGLQISANGGLGHLLVTALRS